MKRRVPLTGRMLLAMALVLAVPVLTLAGMISYQADTLRADAESKADATLAMAAHLEESHLRERLTAVRSVAEAGAGDPAVVATLSGDGAPVVDLTRYARVFTQADLLVLVDRQGHVVARSSSNVTGDRLQVDGLVDLVISRGETQAYPGVLSAAELRGEADWVRDQVTMPVMAPRGSTTHEAGGVVDSGLALLGVAPVRSASGSVLGAVVAADILNRDFGLVDEVARWSPPDARLNATIALDGVRVATNVRMTDPEGNVTDQRALGTLFSDRVMEALRANQEYRGRALVLETWHRTIYRPMEDYRGRVIAAAYVGIPESYFLSLGVEVDDTTRVAGALGGSALVLVFAGAWWWLRRPLRELDTLADRAGTEAEHLLAARALREAVRLQQEATQTAERLQALQEAVRALTEGARKEERAVGYVGQVTREMAGGLGETRTHVDDVVRAVAGLTAGARSAIRQAGEFAAGLAILRQDLEASGRSYPALDLLRDPSELLSAMACQAERVADQVRTLALILQENEARLGYIGGEMHRVQAVVQSTSQRTRDAGETARVVMREVEATVAAAAAFGGELDVLRSHLQQVAVLAQEWKAKG
jgi:hypothetical protein